MNGQLGLEVDDLGCAQVDDQQQPSNLLELAPAEHTQLYEAHDSVFGAIVSAAIRSGCSSSSLRLAAQRFATLYDRFVDELTLIGRLNPWALGRTENRIRHKRSRPPQLLADISRAVMRRTGLKSLTLKNMAPKELAAALPDDVMARLHALCIKRCDPRQFGGLGACKSLQQLTLDEDKSDRTPSLLPLVTQLSSLTTLRSLTIRIRLRDDVEKATLADALAPLVHLTQLTLMSGTVGDLNTMCGGINNVGEAICHMTSLQELKLYDFERIDVAPLAALAQLRELNMSATHFEGHITQLSSLTSLSKLHLSGAEWLLFEGEGDEGAACDLFPSIKDMRVHAVTEALACFARHNAAHRIRTFYTTRMEPGDAPLVGRMTQVQVLDLGAVEGSLQPVSGLTQLLELTVHHVLHLSSLEPLASLHSLQKLRLRRVCPELVRRSLLLDVGPLAALAELQELELCCFDFPGSLAPLASLVQLRLLHLDGCTGFSDLVPLSGLTLMQDLAVKKYERNMDARYNCELLAHLTGLRRLALLGYQGDLSPLSQLLQLQALDIGNSDGLTSLEPLSGLVQLQELRMGPCPGVSSLQPLAGLQQLQQLHIIDCSGVSSLEPLTGLVEMKELDLSSCTSITDLLPLAGLHQLRVLDLSRCQGVQSADPLHGLAELRELDLSWCRGISDLTPLRGLHRLWSLRCLRYMRTQARQLTQLRELWD